jgi:hypothetical protein
LVFPPEIVLILYNGTIQNRYTSPSPPTLVYLVYSCLKKGKAFKFSNKGFELQLFVALDELNEKTAQQFEQSFGVQEDLFSNVA